MLYTVEEQTLKTAFKKSYAVASQAWQQVVSDNPNLFVDKGGWICTWTDGTTEDGNAVDTRHEYFKAKMKIAKTCINEEGCWPETYETQGTQDVVEPGGPSAPPSKYSWITTDGMCWAAPVADNGAWSDSSHIIVDTNCNKKPNKIGQDIFSFLLGIDGIVYFAIGDQETGGQPVSKGKVCPFVSDPATYDGRSVSFSNWFNS